MTSAYLIFKKTVNVCYDENVLFVVHDKLSLVFLIRLMMAF